MTINSQGGENTGSGSRCHVVWADSPVSVPGGWSRGECGIQVGIFFWFFVTDREEAWLDKE